jgi:hypothetical protein
MGGAPCQHVGRLEGGSYRPHASEGGCWRSGAAATLYHNEFRLTEVHQRLADVRACLAEARACLAEARASGRSEDSARGCLPRRSARERPKNGARARGEPASPKRARAAEEWRARAKAGERPFTPRAAYLSISGLKL